MKKYLLILCLICNFIVVSAQSPQLKELWKLSKNKKYEELIKKGEQFLQKDSNNVEYQMMVGIALFRLNKIDKSKEHFEKAALHNDPHSSIRARSKVYLALCYFLECDYEKSKEALLDCKKIKSYSSIKEYNEYWFERLGFHDFYNNWYIKETDHFRFYFQDTSDLNYKRFICKCEDAYTKIDTFFNSDVPKKVDYFVWTSTTDARNIIKRASAFAYSSLCLIHGNTNENEGHEIAHVISLNYTKDIKKYKFISEGTAVYFDQTDLDIEQWFEGVLKKYKIKKIDVKDVWEKWEKHPSDYSYHLGGLFVEELIKEYGQEKFLEFFADQSYKNAKKVFGKGLDDFIKEFEESLASKL